jgi:7-keto-8-aminopelargonate synthetase-like enzyme
LIQTLINKARGFIYSTALPPASVASARCALDVIQTDPNPRQTLWENIQAFHQCMLEAGLSGLIPETPKSPIVPVILGERTLQASQQLLESGYYIRGIRPPTVPPKTSRLRIALSAAHSLMQIQGLVTALGRCLSVKCI